MTPEIRACARVALLRARVGVGRFVIRASRERGVGVPSSRSLATASREANSLPLASTRRGPGQEGQTELADLDLITIDQHRRIHRLPVDIGAVEAADIDDAELALLPLELGVAAADGNVVEEDVAVGMAARGCDGLVQQKSGTRVGAACDDETLLDRGSDGDVAEAEAAIERLAAAPADEGLVIRDIWLLRLRALLARARGDDAAYTDLRDRYRDMAKSLGFEGHIAWAEAMS
jgi:hypothetical protein